jgi:hypothetical protein
MSHARKADRLALPEKIWSPKNDSKEETESWFPSFELQSRQILVGQRSVCPTEAELLLLFFVITLKPRVE